MKKLIVLAAGLALIVPTLAFADSFSLRVGYFMPRALSSSYLTLHPNSLWFVEFDQMTFALKDFRGGTLGASYERFFGPNLSLVLGVDTFSRRRLGDYWDYDQTEFTEGWFAFPVDLEPADIPDWYYISHSFRVSSTPVTLSVKLAPLGRKTKLIPFVGGGAGLYFWNTSLYGEMVDFSDPWIYTDPILGDIDIFPVISINSREKGMAVGYHAFAGLQFPIGYRATIDAEVRYNWAKGKFDDGLLVDFDDFDLGGLALTVGFSYWF
jgi:opacity protein-like surface antigen